MNETVLLVSNSVLTREVLSEPLEARGYEVLIAEDTWEAVGLCAAHGVDVVLMDPDWPGDSAWDGWELIKGALGAKPRLPIVILTGRFDLEEAARAAGARGLAGKPLDVNALVELMERLVSDGQAREPRRSSPRVDDFEHIPPDEVGFRTAIEEGARSSFMEGINRRVTC